MLSLDQKALVVSVYYKMATIIFNEPKKDN